MQHRCCSEGRNNSCYTQWEPLHHFSHMVDITILHSKYVNTYNIFSKGDIIVVSFLQITLIRRSRSNAESFPILTLTDISPMLEDHVPHVLTFPSMYSMILSLSFSMSLWEMQNKTGDKKAYWKYTELGTFHAGFSLLLHRSVLSPIAWMEKSSIRWRIY